MSGSVHLGALGLGGLGGLGPIEGPREPEQADGSGAAAGPIEGPVVRQPTSTRTPDLAALVMRERLLGVGPALAEPESFADRIDRRTAERQKVTLDDLPDAAHTGLRGEWNKLLVDLANEDPNLADEAERAMRGAIEGELTKLVERSNGDKPTAAQVAAISGALASELRNLEVGGVSIDALGDGLDLLVGDLGVALARGLSFRKAEREVREEAREAGGLFPGEDVAVNERVGKPMAEGAAAGVERVEERLEAKFYFKGGAKIDAKKLLKSIEEAVGEVKVDTGFTFSKGELRGKVGAEIAIDDPLTQGASARLRGYAEVRHGGFSAGVEGKAVVEKLYTDPTFGPRADVSMYLRYQDPKISASLEGRASVPLHAGAGHTWGANAALGYRLSPNATLSAGVGVSGGSGLPTQTTANVGLTIRW